MSVTGKAGANRQAAQMLLLRVSRLTAIQQMIADQGGGVGAELGRHPIVGSGGMTEGQGPFLAEIVPA